MKTYTYKGYKFYKTRLIHSNTLKPLYEIVRNTEDETIKPAARRPFLTSIDDCKQWILNNVIEKEG